MLTMEYSYNKSPPRSGLNSIIPVVFISLILIALIFGLIFGLPRLASQSVGNVLSSSGVNSLPTGVNSSYMRYRYAAVTTDTDHCSTIGTDILGGGKGSAVDAAIATYLCSCIINAHSCGIGGGHFSTIYETPLGSTTKSVKTVIARERAPGAANKYLFVNKTGRTPSLFGGLAVGVPGEVAGLYKAWSTYGRLPWKDLFTEAIRLCVEGFIVEHALSVAITQNNLTILADPNFSELFVKSNGKFIQMGDLLVNRKLGATLQRIADDPMTFYNGSLASDIIADLQEYDSIITLADLVNYQAELKDPVVVSLNNKAYKVFGPPPPSSGVVLSFILCVLDGYNFGSVDLSTDDQKILTYQRIAEAFKFGYAKRSLLGDEDFVNVTALIANLTSPAYCQSIRAQIDDNWTHDVSYYGPTFDIVPDAGTTHINVLAPDGAAVSLTGTINLYFGAKVRGRRTGIIFNDEMDDFSTPDTVNNFGVPASPSNYIAPGKIPQSSMSPTIVQDAAGNVVLVSGAAGGTIITTATAFVAMHSLWFGVNLKESTDMGRLHHQLVPNILQYESWFENAVLLGLQKKNQTTQVLSTFAIVGSIRNNCFGQLGNMSSANQCIEAVSDGRKGGIPDGF